MESKTETTAAEKSAGTQKREKIAQQLGKGWKFYKNYPVILQESVDYNIKLIHLPSKCFSNLFSPS